MRVACLNSAKNSARTAWSCINIKRPLHFWQDFFLFGQMSVTTCRNIFSSARTFCTTIDGPVHQSSRIFPSPSSSPWTVYPVTPRHSRHTMFHPHKTLLHLHYTPDTSCNTPVTKCYTLFTPCYIPLHPDTPYYNPFHPVTTQVHPVTTHYTMLHTVTPCYTHL